MDVTARPEEDLVDANPQMGSVGFEAVQGVHADALLTRAPHDTRQMSEVAAKAHCNYKKISLITQVVSSSSAYNEYLNELVTNQSTTKYTQLSSASTCSPRLICTDG